MVRHSDATARASRDELVRIAVTIQIVIAQMAQFADIAPKQMASLFMHVIVVQNLVGILDRPVQLMDVEASAIAKLIEELVQVALGVMVTIFFVAVIVPTVV